ncbi:hypothetical protein P296_14045 [Salmonella enterica subsp. arizonae serovar 18:z4,z23:- str. CVM N26624]|uniref:Uncharacterized protein n=1 Tax=Salmonella enterica subsp. arizonae serovar 18:z4,z23:- str. CVM N26626 TaxID=1395119 RepID=A0A3S5YL88_SALER|nr:hypothetical protein P296_14045 [Salmonella enterica subsp. arizonae serovar 18:z4,z23:- str. CVM N26624]OLW00782.1 hypothetical protein P298_13195 [Salmonella enterica subsp. arizonae serovar 18:z4,z23:- str. CVM N26626]OLW02446.1 hypothetical protein P297_00170 [Salmonella enterica subsp. arizonae serovar 18:z4,z23:- str. CVM N26625]OLW05988.1 hypothetical protein P293_03605 [Salmonella enterica subsp. arizonae serovar 18:z4,z23:- str. CVM N20028]OLW10801.1 hypothetical protein P295_11705 
MFKRITEDSDASVNHQNIQRPIFTYEVNDGIAIALFVWKAMPLVSTASFSAASRYPA